MSRIQRINVLLLALWVGSGLTVCSEPASAATACWKDNFKKCCDVNPIPSREVSCSNGEVTWTCAASIIQDDNVREAVKSSTGWSQKTTSKDAGLVCKYKAATCGANVNVCVYGSPSSSTCDVESWGSGSSQCDSRFLSVGCDPNDLACLLAAAEGCPEEENPPCDPALGCEEPPGV